MNHHDTEDVRHTDVIIRERRAQDRTPLYIAAAVLVFALFGGLFWAASNDEDDTRLSREEVRVESETNIQTTTPQPYSVEAYSLEVRDLRTDTDALLASATVANRAEIEAYQNRVNVLEQRLQSNRNDASEQQAIEAELASLRNDYQSLEQRAQTAANDAQEARADATTARAEASDAKAQADTVAFASAAEDRLEKLEEDLEEVNPGQATSQLAVQVEALSKEIESMMDRVSDLESDEVLTEAEMKGMETALADLEERVQNVNTSVSVIEE